MTGRQIQAIRRSLKESVAIFAARFAVSPRTVEDWEQGRRAPRGLTLLALDQLAHPQRRPKKLRGAALTLTR